MALERLQKILARAGIGSRRACEDLIADGRVTVDGRAASEPGTKADPETQDVRLDGRALRPEPHEYWILNKPKGVVCTNADPAGRTRPVDLIPESGRRLFPVGRLDADSKGLLLMTNDGDLANRLMHPRYEVPKTYLAQVAGPVTREDVRRLIQGVYVAEGKTQRAKVSVLKRSRSRSTLEITIREGRNRQIRRMLARLRHPVRELVRTRLGRISLRGLGPGKARRLTADEIEYLRRLPGAPPVEEERASTGAERGRGLRRTGAGPPGDRAPGRARGRPPARKTGSKRPGKGDRKHDSVGTGTSGRDHGRDAGRGRGRGPRRRDGPPPRGRRPRRDSPQ